MYAQSRKTMYERHERCYMHTVECKWAIMAHLFYSHSSIRNLFLPAAPQLHRSFLRFKKLLVWWCEHMALKHQKGFLETSASIYLSMLCAKYESTQGCYYFHKVKMEILKYCLLQHGAFIQSQGKKVTFVVSVAYCLNLQDVSAQ